MSKFQIITLAVFVLCIIGGVAGFALFKGSTSNNSLPSITIWGTFPASTFNQYVSNININLAQQVSIKYVEEDPSTFHQDFINALARGNGPDAILIPADMILPEANTLTPIPYTALPERTYLDTYIQEADRYLTQNGTLAVPFTVDPLVMYWNRTMFSTAGLATYPKFWDEFSGINQKITIKDSNGNVRKTAIAMGDFTNMTNAREVLGALFMQLGNPVTTGSVGSTLSTVKTAFSVDPTPAVKFFSQFVDPTNANYSWNRSLPNDKSAFLSGMLATYFGFASEIADVRSKNPNLNFDVAAIPQVRNGGTKSTYGRMYGFSIVRASSNANAAYQTISIITAPQYLTDLSKTMYLPTVLTSVIADGSTDPYMTIFNQAALISSTWLDAGPAVSKQIFGNLVQSIESGQKTVQRAIDDAGIQYDASLKQAQL